MLLTAPIAAVEFDKSPSVALHWLHRLVGLEAVETTQ